MAKNWREQIGRITGFFGGDPQFVKALAVKRVVNIGAQLLQLIESCRRS